MPGAPGPADATSAVDDMGARACVSPATNPAASSSRAACSRRAPSAPGTPSAAGAAVRRRRRLVASTPAAGRAPRGTAPSRAARPRAPARRPGAKGSARRTQPSLRRIVASRSSTGRPRARACVGGPTCCPPARHAESMEGVWIERRSTRRVAPPRDRRQHRRRLRRLWTARCAHGATSRRRCGQRPRRTSSVRRALSLRHYKGCHPLARRAWQLPVT